ncbi:MAG: preprotein translocase subunit YajC [Peptostreptococcales bacterium]|jgi:preprotein translocase subunit YajC
MDQISFIFPILLIVVFYFLLIKPQKKREKEITTMRSSIKVGDHIITIGGLRGKIIKIKNDIITVEIGDDRTKIEMLRWAISSIEQKNVGDIKQAEDDPEMMINLVEEEPEMIVNPVEEELDGEDN